MVVLTATHHPQPRTHKVRGFWGVSTMTDRTRTDELVDFRPTADCDERIAALLPADHIAGDPYPFNEDGENEILADVYENADSDWVATIRIQLGAGSDYIEWN